MGRLLDDTVGAPGARSLGALPPAIGTGLTTKELAQRLGANERTVRRHQRAGVPVLAQGRVIRGASDSVPRGTASGAAAAGTANNARGSLQR